MRFLICGSKLCVVGRNCLIRGDGSARAEIIDELVDAESADTGFFVRGHTLKFHALSGLNCSTPGNNGVGQIVPFIFESDAVHHGLGAAD